MWSKWLYYSLFAAMLMLFGCADQQGNTQYNDAAASQTIGEGGEEDAVVALGSSGRKDDDAGKADDGGKADDADDDDAGKADDADDDDDTTDAGKADEGDDDDANDDDDGGKDDDYNDDDEDIDDGDDPSQSPHQNDDDMDNDDDIDEDDGDDVVVDLPVEACVYNDPDNPNFTIPAGQFGPNMPPIDIPSTHITGDWQDDGDTFIGDFRLFEYGRGTGNFQLNWDNRAGRIPYDYTLVVTGGQDDQCTAYMRFVRQNPRTHNGCFDQNTKIRMASGKDMIMALLSEGDMVWNPVLKKAVRVAEVVKGPEATKPMYEIGYGATVVRMTENHPVPLKTGALITAKTVKVGDEVLGADGKHHKVTVAKKLPINPKQVVVNLRLESTSSDVQQHVVLSNGIVTGDLHLQRMLEQTGPEAVAKQ